MDWKGAGLALCVVILGTPAFAQTGARVELVCNGTFSFLNASATRLDDVRSDGVFVRIDPKSVSIMGGIGALKDTMLPVTSTNEAEVMFKSAYGVSGSVNRYSGRLVASRIDDATNKVDFIYEATCSRPKAIF